MKLIFWTNSCEFLKTSKIEDGALFIVNNKVPTSAQTDKFFGMSSEILKLLGVLANRMDNGRSNFSDCHTTGKKKPRKVKLFKKCEGKITQPPPVENGVTQEILISETNDVLLNNLKASSDKEFNSPNVTPVNITKKSEKVKCSGDDEIAVTQPLILSEDNAKQISIPENVVNQTLYVDPADDFGECESITPFYQEFDGHANVAMSECEVEEVTKFHITSINQEISDKLGHVDVLLFPRLPKSMKTNTVTQFCTSQVKIGDTLFVGFAASKNFDGEVTQTIFQGLVHKETLGRKASKMSHYKFRRKLLKSRN